MSHRWIHSLVLVLDNPIYKHSPHTAIRLHIGTDRRGSCAMLQRDARDLRTDREVRETLSETYTTFSTMGANCPIGGVPKSLAFRSPNHLHCPYAPLFDEPSPPF